MDEEDYPLRKRSILSTVLIILGIISISYPPYTYFNSLYQQSKQRAVLLNEEKAAEESVIVNESDNKKVKASTANVLTEGKSSNKNIDGFIIEAPTIKLSAVVFDGTSASVLKKGPGWYEKSALPGAGNTAIAGHRTMFGGWFRDLEKLKTGEPIIIKYNGKDYVYTVNKSYTVKSNDWSIIEEIGYPALTLTTCAHGDNSKRFVVRATLTS